MYTYREHGYCCFHTTGCAYSDLAVWHASTRALIRSKKALTQPNRWHGMTWSGSERSFVDKSVRRIGVCPFVLDTTKGPPPQERQSGSAVGRSVGRFRVGTSAELEQRRHTRRSPRVHGGGHKMGGAPCAEVGDRSWLTPTTTTPPGLVQNRWPC